MIIVPAKPSDYKEVTDVWQASVKATHHFLPSDFTENLREQVETVYLPMVQLYCAKNEEDKILGFLGVADQKIEMLFLDPNIRGKGLGKQLTEFAIQTLKVNAVDVNEQNEQAVGFYLKMGFKQIGRSEKDGQGNDYPILHLSL
ncbi:acetyltransferase [Sediminibacterium sp. KACHI17]|uniref:Acetyltransferase n=1 Tax=Sediminibacterium sp. KACHI17 TaxID=1751071 RepID=A0AAT9GFW8_9BACT